MRFSKDNQPTKRRKPSGVPPKEVLSVRVKPKTKEYFSTHKEAGVVLDEYVEKEIKRNRYEDD